MGFLSKLFGSKKKRRTTVIREVPTKSPEEIALIRKMTEQLDAQIKANEVQAAFQEDFNQRFLDSLPDKETQARIDKQEIELREQRIQLQQAQLDEAAAQGVYDKELFESMRDAADEITALAAAQPRFSEEEQAEFNRIQLDAKQRLADLQAQEIEQALTRGAQEDELFAETLNAVKNAGKATPEQEQLISEMIAGARQEGISSIDLNRDLSLEQIKQAKDTRLQDLGEDVASAISGISADVFSRLNALEQETGQSLDEIDRISVDQLEKVRDIMAPSRGLRPTDTPITDRAFEIAGEATRASAGIISRAQSIKGGLTQQAQRAVSDIRARAGREEADIGRESERATTGVQSRSDILKAQLEGSLSAQEAQAKLNFPLEVARTKGGLAIPAASTIASGTRFNQEQGRLASLAQSELGLTSAQAKSGLASNALGNSQALQALQAQLGQQATQNRFSLFGTGGSLGLGLAGQGPNATGLASVLSNERIAGTTTRETTTERARKSPIEIAGRIAAAVATGGTSELAFAAKDINAGKSTGSKNF